MSTISQPFDSVAATYDATFTERRLGRWLRDAVHEQLAAAFGGGDHVLELGCGTGEDAVWLARRGVDVTATDASPAMLEQAAGKATAAGVAARVAFERLDLGQPWLAPISEASYDGAFANFGPLNCVADRKSVATLLARLVRPGGRVLLVMINPLCPWEVAWHLAHGDARRALRRLRGGGAAHVGAGATAQVWYPSARRLRSEFAPGFRHVETRGVGALLPPSYLAGLVERWPQLFQSLALLERRVAAGFPWRWLNDHYLIRFERR